MVAADVHGALGIAGLQVEFPRRLRHLLEQELRIEHDLLAVHLLAGLAELVERLVEKELDADLADDPAPAPVEDRHRVLAEDFVAGQRVHEHPSPPP